MRLILVFCLLISQAFAIDVIPMNKDDKAPEKGFFLNTANMKQVRTYNEERKLLKRENIELKDLAVINEKRVDNYRKYSDGLEKEIAWEKTKGGWKGIGGFVVGVIATSVAAYAAIRIAR